MLGADTKETAFGRKDWSEGKSKIRTTNIGDMLITDEEITELFFEGKREFLDYFFTIGNLKPVLTTSKKSPSYILREVISTVKKIYKEIN